MGEHAGSTATLGDRQVARYVSEDGQEAKLLLPRPGERTFTPPPFIDFYDRALDQRVTFAYSGEA